MNTPEALIFAPDWKLVRWLASQNPLMYWGGEVPFSVIGDATPPIEEPQATQAPGAAE